MVASIRCWQIASLRSLPRSTGVNLCFGAQRFSRVCVSRDHRRLVRSLAGKEMAADQTKSGGSTTKALLDVPNQSVAQDMLDFINAAVTQYHAVGMRARAPHVSYRSFHVMPCHTPRCAAAEWNRKPRLTDRA